MSSKATGGGQSGNDGNPLLTPWKVGLINNQGKYLTAESFGYNINAAAAALRRKQLWMVEQDSSEDDTVYIRSHLGRYLAGDKKGNVTCSSEDRGEAERFILHYHPDGSGRWALCNRTTGYYFGGTDDQLQCYEKQPGPSEWWIVHLATHPQVSLRHVYRQKYARLDPTTQRLQVTELIPWGRGSLVELEFSNGLYSVKTSDGRYLHRDGNLVDKPSTADTMFSVEMKSSGQLSGMALRDSTGKYLTAVGRDAVIQTRNKSIGRDELFAMEVSQPQVFFTEHNGKVASIRQGVNVTAYLDDELTDKETFQIEFDKRTDQWRVRTYVDTYWVLADSSTGIQSTGNSRSPSGLFTVDWLPDGAITLRATNGRYFTSRMNGSLHAASESVDERERFYVTIVNRPQLVLRCEFGFVGFRTTNHPRYECNKTTYDVISVEHSNGLSGFYGLIGHNGKYVSVDSEGNLNADQDEPHPFAIELRRHSRLALRAPNGCYVRGEQNGLMTATHVELGKATLWEY